MPAPLFHIGAGSRPGEIQQLNVKESIISVVTNIEDDEILTLEKSNVENPSGPSEVEKTAGEWDTVHTIVSRNSTNTSGGNQTNNMKFSDNSLYSPASNTESDFSSRSMPIGPKPMRRISRIVVADGGGKWERKRMSPVEANEKSTKRQTRLETQVKSRVGRCDCGEIAPKHGFYTKFDDQTINVKCVGSRSQTELSVGYKLITVTKKLRARNAHNIERFKSDYEKENDAEQNKVNKKEEKMERNQSQEGKEEKAKAKENALIKEKEKREKLKKIRKIHDEKERQQTKEKDKEISIKSKTKIKNQEKRVHVISNEKEVNSQEDDNQEKISDRDSDWEIERTVNNRKYKNYSPNGEAVQRAQQGANDLRFDITRAARKWAKITEDKLRKRHKEEGMDVPYEVIYGGKLEALFKYYHRKLTDEHQHEFLDFRDQLMVLTSDIEEENQEPQKQQVGKTMGKPKLKPAVETTSKETIVNKPGPSCEISNRFQALANSESFDQKRRIHSETCVNEKHDSRYFHKGFTESET
ncbi:hypothetical protein JTB14_001253 [Gonioctena quinquepunctata]|nr:hypothetical protein JTB14_001253 [Gonioctena quinquepunctata]